MRTPLPTCARMRFCTTAVLTTPVTEAVPMASAPLAAPM